jgi:hypothetical protein
MWVFFLLFLMNWNASYFPWNCVFTYHKHTHLDTYPSMEFTLLPSVSSEDLVYHSDCFVGSSCLILFFPPAHLHQSNYSLQQGFECTEKVRPDWAEHRTWRLWFVRSFLMQSCSLWRSRQSTG